MMKMLVARLFPIMIFFMVPTTGTAALVITVNGSTHTIAADESGDPAINVDAEDVILTINSGVTVSATNDTINEGRGGVVVGQVDDGAPWGIFSVADLVNNGTISGSTLTTGIGVNVCADSWGIDTATIDNLTNNGLISGEFGVYVSEQNSLVKTLNNSSTGVISGGASAIRIHGGTINAINNAGTISSTGSYGIHLLTNSENVVSHGTLTNALTNSGNISGTIAIYLENNSTIGTIFNSGTITGTGGTAIDLDNSANAFTITNSGTINGAIDLGINDLVINGNSSTITGAVNGTGDVSVNGTFCNASTFNTATFSIAHGGTLRMGDTITTNGGFTNDGTLVVDAGDSYTITGNYIQTANGVFQTGATSDSIYGRLTVTGTADISASNRIDVNVSSNDSLVDGDLLADVLAAGTLQAGALVVTDNSALWDFTGTVDGNTIDLAAKLVKTPIDAVEEEGEEPDPAPLPEQEPEPAPIRSTSIALPAATVLTSFLTGDAAPSDDMQIVLNHLGSLATLAEVAASVHQTLPVLNANAGLAQLSISNNYLRKILDDRLSEVNDDAIANRVSVDKWLWGRLLGGSAEQSERDNIDGFDIHSYGVVLGIDKRRDNDVVLGAAFAYADVDSQSNSEITDTAVDLDSLQFLLYGKKQLGRSLGINMIASYGMNSNKSTRNISINGLNRTAFGNYDSYNTFFLAELNHSNRLNEKTVFTTSCSALYNYIENDRYKENGAGSLNLENMSSSADSFIVSLGAEIEYLINPYQNIFAHAGAGYDFMTDQSSIVSSFEGGGDSFVTRGIEPDELVYDIGIGYQLSLANGFELTGRYDLDGRENFTNHLLTVSCSIPF